jgi:hypothetical protein
MAVHNEPFFDSDGDNSAQALKASSGNLLYLHVVNSNTAQAFVQFFDAATADVTVGTTTPVLSFLVPPGDGTNSGAFEQNWGPDGIEFDHAITYACTTTATGNGDPSTGLTVSGVYK